MGFNPFTYDYKGAAQDFVDSISGADAAKTQQKASDKAIKAQIADNEAARQFMLQQANQGQGFIDQATGQATGALGQGQAGAMGDLAAARGAISGAPDRLAALYDGGLAAGFQTDPGYQFRQQQGEQAINRAAAARGGRLGAGTLQALMGFNQNLASNEFQNYAQRQMGLAGAADQSAMQRSNALAGLYGQSAGLQQSYGNNLASLFSGAANNKANLGIGAAAQNTNLTQANNNALSSGVPYAGGAQQAQANFYGGAAANIGGRLFDWLTSPAKAS